MDNLTHTLIGLAAGEVVARGTRTPRRTPLLLMGMVGGNLPDADLLWSFPPLAPDRLAYIVEHRGYTHTLLGCLLLALVLFLGAAALLRARGQGLKRGEVGLFAGMALLAVMLHLGMDALNEYGVHPFWPWDNRWYYGDSVFIVEPLFWLAMAPLLFQLRTRAARVALGLVLAVGCVAVLAFHRFAAAWWSLPVAAALVALAGRRLSPRAAALSAAGLACMVGAAFALAHSAAATRLRDIAARQFPAATTLDMVLSPAPAHPFCWDLILLQREGEAYHARVGQLSLWRPAAGGAASAPCSRMLEQHGTARLRPLEVPPEAGLFWRGEYSGEVASLAELARRDCDTRRLASFLRAPFAAQLPDKFILGDLRYDRESGPGFAELEVGAASPGRCRAPPWIPPRRDLGF